MDKGRARAEAVPLYPPLRKDHAGNHDARGREGFHAQPLPPGHIILEHGSGSSTCKAASFLNKYIMSVESDLTCARILRAKLWQNNHSTQVLVYHVDIGRTGPWGRPVREVEWRQYHRYLSSIWSERFFKHLNVILIDGRFRAACLVSAMMQITRPVAVLFDDYVPRPKYHLVERMIRPR